MPKDANFKTDYGVMGDKAAKLLELAGTYAGYAKRLRAEATSMGAAYDSADNRAYIARIEVACDHLDRMAKELETGSEKLALQGEAYETREDENTGIASGLAG